MNTGLIIAMAGIGVSTAVAEKICSALGKQDLAEWIRVGGTSLVGATSIGLVINLIKLVKTAFGGQ